MIILCYFFSLAVSASILIWLIKLKKKDPWYVTLRDDKTGYLYLGDDN